MSNMTYAEAVKRAETWYEVYNEECDNDPANGEAAYLDAQALSVLSALAEENAALKLERDKWKDALEKAIRESEHYNAVKQERDRLLAEVREWICESCNTVYPGPPQEGVKCVICPKCDGLTMPRSSVEIRKLRAEMEAANKEWDIKRESLRVAQAEVERLTGQLGECEKMALHFREQREKAEAELAAARSRLEELERRDKYCWQRTDCVGCPEEVACGKRDDALDYREGKAK